MPGVWKRRKPNGLLGRQEDAGGDNENGKPCEASRQKQLISHSHTVTVRDTESGTRETMPHRDFRGPPSMVLVHRGWECGRMPGPFQAAPQGCLI